jgi:hypothetical protein
VLGTAATSVAVVSVAAVGLMMLSGRIDVRRGATVILGCFIVFGAASLAGGIRSTLGAEPVYAAPAIPSALSRPPVTLSVEPWLRTPASSPPSGPAPDTADPFAGASVPNR